MYRDMHMHMDMYLYLYLYLYVFVCMCMLICLCMFMCMHMYAFIFEALSCDLFQVRDFIHQALYDPQHGYFSAKPEAVGILSEPISFNAIKGTEKLEATLTVPSRVSECIRINDQGDISLTWIKRFAFFWDICY